jgi:hypothetical protein
MKRTSGRTMVLCMSLGAIVALLSTSMLHAQTVTGRVVNKPQSLPLSGKTVEVWVVEIGYGLKYTRATTGTDGRFNARLTTSPETKEHETPVTYRLSAAFPNPASETVSADYSTPKRVTVTATLYNVLGQEVMKVADAELMVGKYRISFDTKHLAMGAYILRVQTGNGISRESKFVHGISSPWYTPTPQGQTVQRLGEYTTEPISKTTTTASLDSVRVYGGGIQTKTLRGYGSFTDYLDIGDIAVDSVTNKVVLRGKVKSLHKWNQPNNAIIGAGIRIGTDSSITDSNGEYTLTLPAGTYDVTITSPLTWSRRTVYVLNKDTIHTEYVSETTDFSSFDMERFKDLFGPDWSGRGNQVNRWRFKPEVEMDTSTADGRLWADYQILKLTTDLVEVTKTPLYPDGFFAKLNIIKTGTPSAAGTRGKYLFEWSDSLPPEAAATTGVYRDLSTGEIYSAHTTYKLGLLPITYTRGTNHEQFTGAADGGRNFTDVLDYRTVLNTGPPLKDSSYSINDKHFADLCFSRSGRSFRADPLYPDNDLGDLWYQPPVAKIGANDIVISYHFTKVDGSSLSFETSPAELEREGLNALVRKYEEKTRR